MKTNNYSALLKVPQKKKNKKKQRKEVKAPNICKNFIVSGQMIFPDSAQPTQAELIFLLLVIA